MPPRHKPNRYEVELQKQLDEAQKHLDSRGEELITLRTHIAAKLDEVNALEDKLAGYPALKKENENLKAELAHEKASRKDTEEEYRGKLATVIQDNANMRLERIFALNKTVRGLESQNAALRAALKEVL